MSKDDTRTIAFTPPMECLPVERLPEGDEWALELKLDGYRAQGIRDANRVRLLSRNGKDLSKKYPHVVAALEKALMTDTVVDGELVGFENGRPSFNALQNAGPETLVMFFVFDLLVDGARDIKNLPLSDRRGLLEAKLIPSDVVQLSEHFSGSLSRFIAAVREIGGEGVIAKRLNSRYEPGKRSGEWRKKRITMGQEFIIGGFTPGAHGVDALVVGLYEGKSLTYVARVRAGFVPASRRAVYALLKPLVTDVCPFKNLPEARSGRWGVGLTAAKMKECAWVKPELVANFEFLEWTDTNHVRHIKFVGMRDDKDPRSVIRE
jgi:DNA ligase D-like protein (predicted ligase)